MEDKLFPEYLFLFLDTNKELKELKTLDKKILNYPVDLVRLLVLDPVRNSLQ